MFPEAQLTTVIPVCARPCIMACKRVPVCVCVCVCVLPGLHWCIGKLSSLVLCTYHVLITTNNLESASSLEGIILNSITYRLRYATEAHNLSLYDG